MVKSNQPDFDYIMLIDTEGLLSVEKNDEEYDRRLILFCLAVSHLVIVNVANEVNATLMKMLILCTDSLQKLGVNKVHRPPVHIVLNQKANPDPKMNEAAILKIREELAKVKLDQQIELNEKTFHALPSAFTKAHFDAGQTTSTLLRTDPDFIQNVQRLCKQFVNTAAKSLEQAREQFSDPPRWVKFAATVLDILQKFPDMTYFNDIREREQDDLMRGWIRNVLEREFTPTLRHDLLSEAMGKSVKETKGIFEQKFETMKEAFLIELDNQLKLVAAMENVRKRSRNFLNTQIESLLRAWIESAIMNNERHQLEELVFKGETQFHELIEKTIEAIRKNERYELTKLLPNHDNQFFDNIQETIRNTGRVTEQQAGDIFDKIWNLTYPRVASEFDHDKQIQAALQFVYRNYNIFEKPNLPDIKSLLPLLTCIPRFVEATPATPRTINDGRAQQQNDMQILDTLQKRCITNMSNHTPIQELPFKYETTAQFTRDTIDKFHYLYVPTLMKEYQRYHGHQVANTWSREFHLHLRRFILQKDAEPAPSDARPGIWKKLLHVKKSFDELLDIILRAITINETENRRRSVDIDLVQQLVGKVLDHINKIDNELDIFKLAASKHYLGTMHTYTVLTLTKFYYDEQWHFFDDVLSKVREKKPGWRDYFIVMVTQDQNADPRFAQDLVQVFVNSVIAYFQKKAQEHIKTKVKDEKNQLDRLALLVELDQKVSTMSDDELYNYITDPVKALNKRFDELWVSKKTAIELFITECKQECKSIIEQFFQVFKTIQSVLQQHQADKATFVSELFTTSDGSGSLNIVNKGRCVSLLLYEYFSKKNPLPVRYQVFNITYLLSQTGIEMMKNFPPLPPARPDKTDVATILSMMANKFNTTSVLNLTTFVEECLKQKSTATQSFENQSNSTIIFLNNLCSEEKRIFEMSQCAELCPCCNRICDVDHSFKKAAAAAGTGENLHSCQVGHQYRAFAKIEYEKKHDVTGLNEASVKRCENIKDHDIIYTPGNGSRCSWSEYKGTPKCKGWDWKFESKVQDIHTGRLTSNLPSIWRRIGERWCRNHRMQYVITNTEAKVESHHYLMLLDGSGSMHGNRWSSLMNAIRKFIDIRKAARTDDVVSFVVFSDSAKIELELFKEIKLLGENHLQQLQNSMPACGTNFEQAFKMAIDILTSVQRNDKVRKLPQIIVFMTDGESAYPQQQILALSTTYRSMIREFWTVACETSNLTILEQINRVMNGHFKDLKKAEDLVSTFAEIAH